MADAQPAGQGLESRVIHFIQVADAAVGDRAHAAQGPMETAGDLAPDGPDHAGLVEVLHDDDLRAPTRRRRNGDIRSRRWGCGAACSGLLGSKTAVTA